MKAQILKIAGVKSEKEFYKKFPTEEAFMKKYAKQLSKLKKAATGDVLNNNIQPMNGTDLLERNKKNVLSGLGEFKDRAFELGVDSMLTQDELEEYEYKAKIDALYSQQQEKKGGGLMSMLTPENMEKAKGLLGGLSKGGGNGGGTVEVGELEMLKKGGKVKGSEKDMFEPHMMYDPKTKKGKKAMTYKEHLALKKKGWGHEAPKAMGGFSGGGGSTATPSWGQDIDIPEGATRQGRYNSDGSAAPSVGSQVLTQIEGTPIIGDIAMGIGKIQGQKDALKDLKQMKEVTGIQYQAAMTKPEEVEREYVRPEDVQNTGEEFFPIYGVGTNVLAKNGATLFNNPDYTPLINVNKAKSFMNGGYLPKAMGGFSGGSGGSGGGGMTSGGYDQIGNIAGNMAYGDKAERDAGSNIGGGVGRGIGMLVGGPAGGAIGEFIGSGIGDLVDRNDRRQQLERDQIDRNISMMTNMKIGPQIHSGYASHMKEGGRVPGPQVVKYMGGNSVSKLFKPDPKMNTLKEGGSVAANGDIKTLWGGEANAVSYNPYAGGQSISFTGNSHDTKDAKTGKTGIGVAYGPQSVANNEAVVEVENEPAQIMKDGGNQESLVVFGDLKIPKGYAQEIGDKNAGGQKFKKYVDNLNSEESKINKQMGTAVDTAADIDNTKWGELLRSTSDVIVNGGDMKLKDIANKKRVLADIQSALNDTFEENNIDGNQFISKGVLKDVKDTENYAKNGKKETYTEYAEDGRKIPKAQKGLTLNELPFKSAEEAIAAGYTLDEDKNSENFGKYYIEEESSDTETNTEVDFIKDIPEDQKFGGSDIGKMVNKKITAEQYNDWKKDNKWFFDKNPDWKADTKEDVMLFQREFNKINPNSIKVDGLFGDQTISARFKSEDSETPKTERRYRDVAVAEEEEEVVTTEETTTVKSKIPFDVNMLRPLFSEELENNLDYNQIIPELNAAANNQLEPVYAQTFDPRLRVPYDISLQDQMNEVTAAYRAASQNPAAMNNPALQASMAAPMYSAINQTKGEEFRQNQAMKDTVYSGNIEAINQAKKMNLGIYDQQQQRQAQALSNTKATQQEIVKSISDKYQANKQLNQRQKVLSELYNQFGYTKNLDIVNDGPPAVFNIPGMGPTGQVGTGNKYMDMFNILTGGGFNPNANQQTTTDTTTVAEYGAKLKPIKTVKRNQKNSNVVRAYKKL